MFSVRHSRGVVLLMCPGDYDVFPEGRSLTSESYLAAQPAVRLTKVESPPRINQKPAQRRDVPGL